MTLFAFVGAGFSFLDNWNLGFEKVSLEAARKQPKKSNEHSDKSAKKVSSKKKTEEVKATEDYGFLMDDPSSRNYMPDIYRCPDCGYEQDEPGFCPDHITLELVKIISNPKDPLAPAEYDGNEDILVDIPLNLEFKKDNIEAKPEEEQETKKGLEKKSKKSK